MPIPETQYSVVGYDSQSAPYPAPPSLDGTAAAAIDGDYGTEWTSSYNGSTDSPMPHWLTIDTGKTYDMTGVDYSVKLGNGEIAKYRIYATSSASVAKNTSSKGWGAPVATGTFAAPTSNTEIQLATFTHPVWARYVKFVALSSIDGSSLASASELRVQARGSYGTPLYSVSTGSLGSSTSADDTPASPFIDKNGTFYYESAHADYGLTDGRAWDFFSGTNMDTATADAALDNAVNPANSNDSNADTTERCNNSPTGLTSTYAPSGSGYAERNYCDLTQVWVDPDTGNWYGLVHNEFTPQPFGDGLHYDAIDFAVSMNQGKTWKIVGHAITSPYSTTREDTKAFPQETYYYGDGDPRLYVDTASGYFYVYYGSRVVDKQGGWVAFYEHVARAPISGKMATGTWRKYYDGSWSQPGIGGKESNLVPISSTNTTGYTPPSKEYNPMTPGTGTQQIVAGTMPNTSPLFVMDITYDAYLGLYIGEPQNPDQSGNEPQQYYATKSLSDPKWFLLGDSGGSYLTASWYRWFLDGSNATSSSIVGKSFRSYCAYGCNNGSYEQYANITVNTSAPAAPVEVGAKYRIGSQNGGVLTQMSSTSAAVSSRGKGNSNWSGWIFSSNGDGSYTIRNAKTGERLGVDSGTTKDRAWGTAPTVTAATGAPTVGQEWFVVPTVNPTTGLPNGGVRLVNRYSGLVLGMSSGRTDAVATTPARTWNDATNTVDSMPLVSEQVLSLKRY
ncbi:discoidin domain-containing protein [Rudaeicoccus suwonensis]|uniref:Ricin-type beta-trefoil lectin protein n=1 Tax=Rudaeicoccus suwonensis TaxID=657409 RepID=A0A561E110_9MICO|nr:discoidin domain-containing protein [Rudaeicoccus suwonensis]TWE09270.1 ricin-type beta-trefoil lectin protein [Rudaeicoccus suwonensis]